MISERLSFDKVGFSDSNSLDGQLLDHLTLSFECELNHFIKE